MRTQLIVVLAVVFLLAPISLYAELQNVEVGGSIRLRWNYISNAFTDFVGPAPTPETRWSPISVLGRPIGNLLGPGVSSIFDWDNKGDDLSFVEQRTRLHINADFTENVRAFVELDSYDVWGEDFRSVDYVTGVDTRARSVEDIEVYQAYIEASEMWGTPLRLRVGRQELAFGSQFLVGPRDFAFFWTGLSFDAVRVTYDAETFTIDAWASKLFESMSDFFEDDLNFYGIYATCKAVENVVFDIYWMLLEDDRPIPNDLAVIPNGDFLSGLLGVGSYDKTMLHTIGIRSAGKFDAFDFDLELAYQFGEADHIGKLFRVGLIGDDDAEFDNWAGKIDLGYTFDFWRKPRVFASFRYFSGEDKRAVSLWEWLNPFYKPEASVSFNRLFSNEIVSGALDLWNDLSNAWWVRLGAHGAVTDCLRAILCVTYYEAVETFERPAWPYIFPWWTEKSDDYLGTELTLFFEYQYSPDLVIEFGWSHLFVGDGMTEGNFIRWNGMLYTGGTDDDGADYVYAGCRLSF